MEIHTLKTWPESFQSIFAGIKKFDVREDDRDFNVQDVLVLREWNNETERYTGRKVAVEVTYFLKGEFGLPNSLCVMGIERI